AAGEIGWRGQEEAERRERQQPALEVDAVRAGQLVDLELRAEAGGLEQLQQRAGGAGHRHVARGGAEPLLGDLDERLAVVAQPTGLAISQRREDVPVPSLPRAALQAERREEPVAAPGVRRAQRAACDA